MTLHLFPIIIRCRRAGHRQQYLVLVVKELHQHLSLGIAIEHHEQVGCHRDNAVHPVFIAQDTQQCKEPIQTGVVAETQGGDWRFFLKSGIRLRHDVLPKRDRGTLRYARTDSIMAVTSPHILIVGLIDRPHFRRSEDVVKRHTDFHILHIGSDAMKFTQQIHEFFHLFRMHKEGTHQTHGRHLDGSWHSTLQCHLFWRGIGYPRHETAIGLGGYPKCGRQGLQAQQKSRHAGHTSPHDTGAGLHPTVSGEDLRPPLEHPFCQCLLLPCSKSSQVSPSSFGISPNP